MKFLEDHIEVMVRKDGLYSALDDDDDKPERGAGRLRHREPLHQRRSLHTQRQHQSHAGGISDILV